MCTCVHACSCVYRLGAYVCMCIGGQKNFFGIFLSGFPALFSLGGGSSSLLSGTHPVKLMWVASKPREPPYLCLPSSALILKARATTPSLSCDFRGPNSWPHACMPSTLPHWAISPPIIIFRRGGNSSYVGRKHAGVWGKWLLMPGLRFVPT